ncbi:hypothetical protein HNY73_020687 [Argiope bruennichi]|uniref:Uncharacterized protein n=1 Tax=Argiope bruennichi TaxID=94029 RepID=A0A8T0EBH3_ARGBR|nr:hypothetical protein HNY73_020687 [Argiope bruennichi]
MIPEKDVFHLFVESSSPERCREIFSPKTWISSHSKPPPGGQTGMPPIDSLSISDTWCRSRAAINCIDGFLHRARMPPAHPTPNDVSNSPNLDSSPELIPYSRNSGKIRERVSSQERELSPTPGKSKARG